MDNFDFCEKIKELRNDLKLSQAGFAKLIGTNQSTLSAYENGDRLPPYETLITIAQACQVSLDWLCGLGDTKSRTSTLSTYTDLIKILLLLNDAPEIWKEFNLKNYPADNFLQTPYSTLLLEINDIHLVNFYEEWQEISSIRKKTPSGDKLYDIWLKDVYERFDFKLANAMQSLDDLGFQELPFS